jgi:hypothetical protein
MDQGELYVQVTVKSPSDIDEATGLMKFDSKYSTSLFSGMYRILTVESTFSGGKFEQTLDVVRLPRQTSLEPNYPSKTASKEREVAASPLSVNVDAANIGPDFSVKTTGDDKAPGSAPVDDTTPPLQTAEERALAKVDATAPETAITTQTEPVAVPPPPKTETATNSTVSQTELADINSQIVTAITAGQQAVANKDAAAKQFDAAQTRFFANTDDATAGVAYESARQRLEVADNAAKQARAEVNRLVQLKSSLQ